MEPHAYDDSRQRSPSDSSVLTSMGSCDSFSSADNPSRPNSTPYLCPLGSLPPAPAPKRQHHLRASLRKGKWSREEENFAHCIIDSFNHGLLNVTRGTTLRSYLSDRLNCDPMRVTKKFSGTACIGKSVFLPCEYSQQNMQRRQEVKHQLEHLENAFLQKAHVSPPSPPSAIPIEHTPAHPPTHSSTNHPPPPLPSLLPEQSPIFQSDPSTMLPKPFRPHPFPSRHSAPDLSKISLTDTYIINAHEHHNDVATDTMQHTMHKSHINTDSHRAGAGRDKQASLGLLRPRRSVSQSHLSKRTRHDLEDLDLDENVAGDLLVNFFNTVHKTYASQSSLTSHASSPSSSAPSSPSCPPHTPTYPLSSNSDAPLSADSPVHQPLSSNCLRPPVQDGERTGEAGMDVKRQRVEEGP